MAIEQEILDILEKYLNDNALTLKNLETCEYILKKYKDKLYVNSLTSRLLSYFGNIDENYHKNKIKVVSYNNFSANGEIVEKINISSDDCTLDVKYEMVNEVLHTNEGKVTILTHKFFINNYLIFNRCQNDKALKNTVNLTYVQECVNNLKIDVSHYEFLHGFLKLFSTNNIFDPLVQKVGTDTDREKYFFHRDWDSDSNVSSIESDQEDN
jgi:hypothetical protein